MLSTEFYIGVQELRRPERSYEFLVRWHTSIKEILDKLHSETNYPVSRMRIFHSSSSYCLKNRTTLRQLGIDKNGHVLTLSIEFNSTSENMIESVKDYPLDANCKELLGQVQMGLNNSNVPSKTDLLDCTGGVYFMKSASNVFVSVFKPHDEEQGMPNNPKGYAGNGKHGLRANFKPGEGYLREAVAYLLDHENFCQVPPTVIVHCEHPVFNYPKSTEKCMQIFPKLGSLQQYVRASDTFEDISPSLIGTFELQKIALLDIRLLNCDRNASNILAIRKMVPNTFRNPLTGEMRPRAARRESRSGSLASLSEDMDDEEIEMIDFLAESRGVQTTRKTQDLYELIPIDHGYCLPSKLLIEEFDWTWFYCSQIEEEIDPEIRRYMLSLDVEECISKLNISPMKDTVSSDAFFLLRLVHFLIIESIKANMTLKQIAELIARVEDNVKSPMEKLVQDCEENAHRTLEARSFIPSNSAKLALRNVQKEEGNGSVKASMVKFSESGKESWSTKDKRTILHGEDSSFSPIRATQSLLDINNALRPSGALIKIHTIDSAGLMFNGRSANLSSVAGSSTLSNQRKDKKGREFNGDCWPEEPLTSDETSSVEFSMSPRSQLDDFQQFVYCGNHRSENKTQLEHDDDNDYDNCVSLDDSPIDPIVPEAMLLSVDGMGRGHDDNHSVETITPPSTVSTQSDHPTTSLSSYSFHNLEVQTTEPINFDKCSSKRGMKKRYSNRAPPMIQCTSGCTSEEEDFHDFGIPSSSFPTTDSLRKSRLLCGTSSPEGFGSSQEDDRCSVTSQSSSDLLFDIPAGPSFSTMSRVVSFGAFESPALYGMEDDDDESLVMSRPMTTKAANTNASAEKLKRRQFRQLKQEKRYYQRDTVEFRELRYDFAKKAVLKLVQNVKKQSSY